MRALERGLEIGADAGAAEHRVDPVIHREIAVVPPLDRIAGQIREEPSWIGGVDPSIAEYVGPPPTKCRPCSTTCCEFMNRDDISPAAAGGDRPRAVRD